MRREDGGDEVRALAYPDLTGPLTPGDGVLMNTSALERGLGTGGYAFVVAILEDERSGEPAPASAPAGFDPGHLVKARYTPMQSMVLSVDEQESAHHEALSGADSIDGMPVVVADLHSSLPAIVAGCRASFADATGRAPRIAYVMTDGGALPIWFSRTVAGLRASEWLATTITSGQAFGGEYEAVTLHTALLAARIVARADLAVVIQGPGNLGTDTRWGFSGVAVGDAVNAIAALGGRAIGALRMSQADARERHLGLSHHSVTAYARVALAAADLVLPPVPDPRPGWWETHVEARLAKILAAPAGHRLVAAPTADLRALLAQCPVPLSTMGRSLAADELAFTAAAAAGWHAGGVATRVTGW